eukprot:m.65803 g.65803  ORF g.65803 m.65803 type:complete len:59 (-) comp18016_c0_seq1:361-537(-)
MCTVWCMSLDSPLGGLGVERGVATALSLVEPLHDWWVRFKVDAHITTIVCGVRSSDTN